MITPKLLSILIQASLYCPHKTHFILLNHQIGFKKRLRCGLSTPTRIKKNRSPSIINRQSFVWCCARAADTAVLLLLLLSALVHMWGSMCVEEETPPKRRLIAQSRRAGCRLRFARVFPCTIRFVKSADSIRVLCLKFNVARVIK